MLRVTPIYGSYGHNPKSKSLSLPPMCTLIEYGGKRVIVDVGWDESFSLSSSSSSSSTSITDTMNHMNVLPEADVVLVCNSSLGSIGGLPYHYGPKNRKRMMQRYSRIIRTHDVNNNNTVNNIEGTVSTTNSTITAAKAAISILSKPPPPIYGTLPTCKMGQMSLYDVHANISLDGGYLGWDLDDVDVVFSTERFHTINYSQSITLQINNKDTLSITPHRSGNLVGGSYWVLRRMQDETEVVVAPIYHHAKEKHLDASTLHKFGVTADVLITRPGGPGGLLSKLYSFNPQQQQQSGTNRKKNKAILQSPLVARAEGELIELVMAALRRGGNVLLPVDASGRVLELILLLSQYWDKNRLATAYNLCWVGPMSWNTIEYARSQLEWMATPLGQQFDSQRGHPYALKSVRICSSISELEAIDEASNGVPMAVLASGANLDCGPARDLLLKFADNPDNAIILTDSQRCVPRPTFMFSNSSNVNNNFDIDSNGKIVKPSTASEDDSGGDTGTTLGMILSSANTSRFSTAAQLLLKWCKAKEVYQEMADVVVIDVLVPHRAPLVGNELKSFLAEEEAARQEKKAQEERKALLREVELARGRLRLGEEEVDDTGGLDSGSKKKSSNESSARSGSQAGEDASSNMDTSNAPPPKKKGKFDQNLFLKFSKPIHMTFEVREEAVGIGQTDSIAKFGVEESIGRSGEVLEDDYGIAVIPEKFMDIVTGIDPSKISGSGRIGDDVLRRGLGFGSDGRPVLGTGSGGVPVIMRSSASDKDGLKDKVDDSDNDLNEQALEASDLSEGKGIIRGRNGKEHIKVSTKPRSLEVLAEVTYVPLEGRVDARAARQSVRALQPRQVIILGGGKLPLNAIAESGLKSPNDGIKNDEGTAEICGEALLLANAVRELTIQAEGGQSIYAPSDGERLSLNVGHAAFSARLIDTIFVEREKREAAAMAGENLPSALLLQHEAKMGSCSVSLIDCVATGKKVAADGSIVLAPRAAPEDSRQKNVMLSDGDVYLTDLRAEIIALGMKAEYSTHPGYQQLVVNGKIVIRKEQANGKIHLEGPLCESFYSVRSIVCSQYVTL